MLVLDCLLADRATRTGGAGLYDFTLDKKPATGIIFGHYAHRFLLSPS